MASEAIYSYLRPVSAHIDVAAIAAGWQLLSPVYDVEQWVLPLPPWARRPYAETGQEAWQRLSHDLTTKPSQEAMCIYLHVPFCSSKCGFCDSYSFKLVAHRQQHVATYASLLEQEMALWGQLGTLPRRPVSTVHLGGGTPTFLGAQALAQVVQACARHFHTTPATEWALESTVYNLPPEMLAHLHKLGFRRLHIGVQSLEDAVRASIGRRCPAHSVLQKIDEALALGWVVSVDLICGLPGQTVPGFLDGVRTLIDRGVDGFSLYELLIYAQNRRWAETYGLTGRAHLPNYLMFQAGAQYLETHGYRKNLFNHWAAERDDNRYFTFPTRGEDLLALGAIADGVFSGYHYRHGRYHEYCTTLAPGFPGLEGGLARNQAENRLRPIVVAILSGHLSDTALAAIRDHMGTDSVRLLELWQRCGLLAHEATSTGLSLTPSGSWFAGNMLLQLEETLCFAVQHSY